MYLAVWQLSWKVSWPGGICRNKPSSVTCPFWQDSLVFLLQLTCLICWSLFTSVTSHRQQQLYSCGHKYIEFPTSCRSGIFRLGCEDFNHHDQFCTCNIDIAVMEALCCLFLKKKIFNSKVKERQKIYHQTLACIVIEINIFKPVCYGCNENSP